MVRVLKLFSMKGVTWKEFPPMIVLVLCVLWIIDWTQQYERDHRPVEEYFIVRQLQVPDHKTGDNPKIAYDREIMKPFWGDWVGEVQALSSFQAVCANAGSWHYDPGTKPPEGGFTLNWFMDKKCTLPPGSYRLQSCWRVHRDDAKPIELCKITVPFNVEEASNEGQVSREPEPRAGTRGRPGR